MNATRSEKTTTEVRYVLDLPTNAVEVDKAINWASKEYQSHYQSYTSKLVADDALTVQSDGEQLVISWVKA